MERLQQKSKVKLVVPFGGDKRLLESLFLNMSYEVIGHSFDVGKGVLREVYGDELEVGRELPSLTSKAGDGGDSSDDDDHEDEDDSERKKKKKKSSKVTKRTHKGNPDTETPISNFFTTESLVLRLYIYILLSSSKPLKK